MELVTLSNKIHTEIRKHRLIHGYSQEYIANYLDISQNSYSRLESGQTNLTLSKLLKIGEILRIQFTS